MSATIVEGRDARRTHVGAERGETVTPFLDRETVRGAAIIVAAGIVLGLVHNQVGRIGKPPTGLDWIARDRSQDVYVLETDADGAEPPAPASAPAGGYHDIDDPMAVFTTPEPARSDLPDLPDLPRPIQMQLPVVKQFYDASGALFVDSRDLEEYAEGHIPGALHVPFDLAATDPAFLESIDTGGRPIIAYCGGGECETSINLAWMLIESGHTRVTYFQSGYPGWEAEGYPVERGEPEVER
jgi:rhodanese-related sulfurtransferase